jgi:hypothetical protein
MDGGGVKSPLRGIRSALSISVTFPREEWEGREGVAVSTGTFLNTRRHAECFIASTVLSRGS